MNYEQIAFGCFSHDHSLGYITQPIPDSPSKCLGELSNVFCERTLVYWMISSMHVDGGGGWVIPESLNLDNDEALLQAR